MIGKEELEQAINVVASTDEGQIVFAYLKKFCNFDTTVLNSQDLQETFAHAVKRSVYTHFRDNIRTEYLITIEHHIKFDPNKKKDKK